MTVIKSKVKCADIGFCVTIEPQECEEGAQIGAQYLPDGSVTLSVSYNVKQIDIMSARTFIPKALRVYDNGGMTIDRYTVLRMDWPHTWDESDRMRECIGMGDRLAYCEHGAAEPGPHLGRRISWEDLPMECRVAAEHFLK